MLSCVECVHLGVECPRFSATHSAVDQVGLLRRGLQAGACGGMSCRLEALPRWAAVHSRHSH